MRLPQPMPTTGKVGDSWCKIQGPSRAERSLGPDYAAYDFGFVDGINICRFTN